MQTSYVRQSSDRGCQRMASCVTHSSSSRRSTSCSPCAERGIGVVAAGIFNSGLLAQPVPAAGARYDCREAGARGTLDGPQGGASPARRRAGAAVACPRPERRRRRARPTLMVFPCARAGALARSASQPWTARSPGGPRGSRASSSTASRLGSCAGTSRRARCSRPSRRSARSSASAGRSSARH